MCGLFGFSSYDSTPKKLTELTNILACNAAARGTDATGIAYINNDKITIKKEPKAAYSLKFEHPSISVLIGHTRHATQGSEKENYNNHPFSGCCKNVTFALAHNGVIHNDTELRYKLRLPSTHIKTDSYIATQIIEQKRKLNFNSLKYMAEKVEGSFSFSIIDSHKNLYLVKGDSPLSILHFPKEKMYLFASTDTILWTSIVESSLFDSMKEGAFEPVEISTGDILKISPDGRISKERFEFRESYFSKWWEFPSKSYKNSYADELKSVAGYYGYEPSDIDKLLDDGFSCSDIEDFLYCGEV